MWSTILYMLFRKLYLFLYFSFLWILAYLKLRHIFLGSGLSHSFSEVLPSFCGWLPEPLLDSIILLATKGVVSSSSSSASSLHLLRFTVCPFRVFFFFFNSKHIVLKLHGESILSPFVNETSNPKKGRQIPHQHMKPSVGLLCHCPPCSSAMCIPLLTATLFLPKIFLPLMVSVTFHITSHTLQYRSHILQKKNVSFPFWVWIISCNIKISNSIHFGSLSVSSL